MPSAQVALAARSFKRAGKTGGTLTKVPRGEFLLVALPPLAEIGDVAARMAVLRGRQMEAKRRLQYQPQQR